MQGTVKLVENKQAQINSYCNTLRKKAMYKLLKTQGLKIEEATGD